MSNESTKSDLRFARIDSGRRERGTATLIAVLVLALVSAFVALALSRVTTEAVVTNNDSLHNKTYYAAQASIELMTRNFGKLFSSTNSPSLAQLQAEVIDKNPANFGGTIQTSPTPAATPTAYDSFADYDFEQNISRTGDPLTNQPIGGGDFEGLSAERTPYLLHTTATHRPTGTSVTLTRTFVSNIIPIFQFGIFYDHDLEFYAGRKFSFGGLVHTNSDLYLLGGGNGSGPDFTTSFSHKVTAFGHVVHDVARNGRPYDNSALPFGDNVTIDNNAPIATPIPFNHAGGDMGSVDGGPDTTSANDKPNGSNRPAPFDWDTDISANVFAGKLKRLTKPLKLPINAGVNKNIEIIKRGRVQGEYEVNQFVAPFAVPRLEDRYVAGLKEARYYNKPGIRITLADNKSKLPNCFSAATADKAVATPCGVRLDGAGDGLGADSGSRTAPTDGSRGYQPRPMDGGAYQAKRVNGYRLYTGASFTDGGLPTTLPNYNRQTWIKVETMSQGGAMMADITENILSLGLTHKDLLGLNIGDDRAVIKLQKYEIQGNNQLAATPTRLDTPKIRKWDGHATIPSVGAIQENWGGNEPSGIPSTLGTCATPGDCRRYAVRWTGKVQALFSEVYTFHLKADDGMRLFVNGEQLVPVTNNPVDETWLDDAPNNREVSKAVSVPLVAGNLYDIRVEYFHNEDLDSQVELYWSTPVNQPKAIIPGSQLFTPGNVRGGLKAEYFSDPGIAGGAAAELTSVKDFVKKPVSSFNSAGNYSYVDTTYSHTTTIDHSSLSTDPTLVADSERTAQASTETVTIGGNTVRLVPFPIEMFDTREGLFNNDAPVAGTLYFGDGTTVNRLPWNGVMSMVDIDMANLGRFLNGTFNGSFPDPFTVNDTTVPNVRGRMIYISDRRGDRDFDGEYDMEDVYGPLSNPTDNVLQAAENVNFNGAVLDRDLEWEGSRYIDGSWEGFTWLSADKPLPSQRTATTYKDLAAVFDHRFFRRGVRLINGQSLFGTPTQGLTVASENAVYVLGNYNATGIASAVQPTPARHFCPNIDPTTSCVQTTGQVPASIVGDAITILSNNWRDGNSFFSPFDVNNRLASETTVRAAMMAGDTISSEYYNSTTGAVLDPSVPTQGGSYEMLNGGVHNYLRLLEFWQDAANVNYSGSLINLYHSRVNNGTYKFGAPHGVYRIRSRNWVFDNSFEDPTRLPPATPSVQHTQVSGFRVVTE